MPASALLLRLLLCSAGSRQGAARVHDRQGSSGRDAVALQSGESPLFNATALESAPLSLLLFCLSCLLCCCQPSLSAWQSCNVAGGGVGGGGLLLACTAVNLHKSEDMQCRLPTGWPSWSVAPPSNVPGPHLLPGYTALQVVSRTSTCTIFNDFGFFCHSVAQLLEGDQNIHWFNFLFLNLITSIC